MVRNMPLAAAALALAACTGSVPPPENTPIPGVELEETSFFAAGLENVLVGENDVIFARSGGKWYRIQLNDGCLDAASGRPTFSFASAGSSKVDRFTRVTVITGGSPYSCRAESIRRSAPPPMVDSDSVVPRG